MFDLGYRYYDYGDVADEIDDEADKVTAPLGHALNNMKAFIRDMEIGPVEGFGNLYYNGDLGRPPKGGRFLYELTGVRRRPGHGYREGRPFSFTLEMPGQHITTVRYIRGDGQRELDYSKVKLDGVPRTWIAALERIDEETKNV